eukprot:jgi/Ulvmu1/4956/UM206_0009.1
MATLSPKAIIHAAASQSSITVDSELQQQFFFRSDQGFQARDAADHSMQIQSQQFLEDGLAVQMRVIQTGAAVWLPVQHGCGWPVQVLLEVSVYSTHALPEGVEIKVAVDAVTDAQRTVIAHGGPLPLPLLRLLAPSALYARKAAATAFAPPGDRRKAHVDVPQGRVWVCELFSFPILTFERHSNMRRVSLMFAATAEARGKASARATADVSATILRPSTVAVQRPEEALASLPQLGLPPDIYHRIFVRRGVLEVYADTPPPASAAAALPLCCLRGGFEELPEHMESGGTLSGGGGALSADGRCSLSGAASGGSDGLQEVTGRTPHSCMTPLHAWPLPPTLAKPFGCAAATDGGSGGACRRAGGGQDDGADLFGAVAYEFEQLDELLDDLSPELCDQMLAEMVADDCGLDNFL